MIVFKNVTVAKAGRKLFDNFSFTIAANEHWIIQGDNGAGKSTFLQLIAGGIHPLSGQIDYSFIDANDWESLYRQRKATIHLIATYGLHTLLHDTGGLFYQQRYYSMGGVEIPRVRDVFGSEIGQLQSLKVADNLRIEQLLDLELTRLSNGQLKKVIILRQLVRNIPRLLLLDYPFDGLDAASRRDLASFLDQIAQQFGIQIILVDHGHDLPQVINKKLILDMFQIKSVEVITPQQTPLTKTQATPVIASIPADDEPVVEMRNVTIAYNGKPILSNINWRINKGERWALTGKNGSGKTTLFSLIYADHPMAYSQAVFLFGKRRGSGESIWDIKRRINYMGPEQNHFLDPKDLTRSAREYILNQSPMKAGRIETLVDFFGAENYIDRPLRSLSSGQLQMTLLMKTFLDDKELLLLDEPFQFLDPHHRAKVTNYLTRYLDRKITLVLITHDEDDVAQWTQKRKQL